MAINIINFILLYLIKKVFIQVYSNEYTNAIKNSVINKNYKNISLENIFDIIITDFSIVYKEKGLLGLKKYFNYLNQTLNNIIVSNLNEQRTSVELKNIAIIGKIFKNLKIVVTLYTFIQSIIGFLTKAALIPFYVLAVYSIVKKLLLFFSFIFSSYITTIYFSSDYKILNSIVNNIIGLKEISRVLWLKSYNYVFNEDIPLYKEEPILEEIVETKSSYLSWLDLSLITNLDYSFTSHPYIYSAIIGVASIGLISSFYYNPSLISDSSNFLWDKSKSLGSFVLSYFIHRDIDDSDGPDSPNSITFVDERNEQARIKAFAMVDKINEQRSRDLKEERLLDSQREAIDSGLFRYHNEDSGAWDSSTNGSSTPTASGSKSPHYMTDQEYSNEASQRWSKRKQRKVS